MSDKCALVVDDDRAIRKLLVAALKHRGVTLDEAADGDIAIERMKTKTYDVVLLDLMMPKVNGFEVLKKMDDERMTTPVIILTAASQRSFETIDSPRVAKIVRKPFDLSEVVRTVLKQCGLPIPPDLAA